MRTPQAQLSHVRYPLAALLGDSGQLRVLRVLLNYEGALSTSQIARDSGLTRQAVRLVLDRLLTLGAVRALGTPRSRLFEAVLDAPFVLALKPLFAVERAHWKRLQQALHSVLARPAVLSAWLYGSVARRQDTPDSDIDLAVVLSDFSIEAQLRDELDEVGKRFNVDLSLITLSPTDVAQRPAEDPWWEGLERDAQVLKGLSPAEQRLTRQSAA